MINDPQPQNRSSSRSVWMWIGCGCGVLLLLGGLGFGGFIWFVVRQAHESERVRHDPVQLAQAVRAVVPYKDLPAGYRPVATFSLPFVMDMAIFADRDVESQNRFNRRLPGSTRSFLVIKTLAFLGHANWKTADSDLEGGKQARQWMKRLGVDLETSTPVTDGTLQLENHTATYRVVRSRRFTSNADTSAVTAVLQIDCGDGHWLHTAVWSTPAEDPDHPAGGTPADPAAIAAMASHFTLCAAGSPSAASPN